MKIEDYLHFYLGCQAQARDERNPELSISTGVLISVSKDSVEIDCGDFIAECTPRECTPILRPHPRYHGGMTSEEAVEICDAIHPNDTKWSVTAKENSILLKFDRIQSDYDMIPHLLNKHFDLFGLIDAGLAIDASTLTPKI